MKQVIRLAIAALFSVQIVASSQGLGRSNNHLPGSADFTQVDVQTQLFEALSQGNFYNQNNPYLKQSARERLEQLQRLGIQQNQESQQQEGHFPEVTNLTPLLPGTPGVPQGPDANRPVIPGLPTLPLRPGTPTPKPSTPQANARVLEGFLGRDVTIAKVSEEFKCDLFGNNPYQEIDRSLTALIEAMKIQPECRDSVNQVEQIQKSNEQILKQIESLRKIIDTENSGVGPKAPNSNALADAANSAQTIIEQLQTNYTRITQNPVFNPRCQALTSSLPQIVKSVSDLASNAAPLVMMALSLAPTVSIQSKLIGIGGSMLASMAGGVAESIIRDGVDLSKEENRRAIVQNVCQFTKVYRKYKIIQLARSSDLSAIQVILNNQIAENEIELEYTNSRLNQILVRRAPFEKHIGEIVKELTQANRQIVEFETSERFKDDSSPADQCGFIYDEIFRSQRGDAVNPFALVPQSLEKSGQVLVEADRTRIISGEASNPSTTSLLRQRAIQQSLRQLESKKANLELQLSGAVAPDSSGTEADISEDFFKSCVESGKQILGETKKLYSETQNVLRAVNQNINRQMESDRMAGDWHKKYLKFRSDVQQVQGLWKLIEEVREKASSLVSSDVALKMDRVRRNLMGEFNSSSWNPISSSSVMTSWMNFQLSSFNRALDTYEDLLKSLQQDASRILAKRSGPAPYRNDPQLKNQYNEQRRLHGHKVPTLEILIDSQEMGPAFRVNVCQKLLATYLEFSKARDFYNSSRFMCSMIREELPLAERRLQEHCQPASALLAVNTQNVQLLTGLNAELANLSQGLPNYGGLSLLQMLSQVTALVRGLECQTVIEIPDITDRSLSDDLGNL